MKESKLRAIPAAAGALAVLFILAGAAAVPGELDRAREAASQGLTDKALDIALAGMKKNPSDRELFLYAVELLPEGPSKYAAPLAAAAAARLERKDEDSAWYLGICKTLRISGKTQEALSNCRKAMELDPTAYPAYRELGLAYAAAGDHRKAGETLAQGVEISSSDYRAHYNLARVLETRGDMNRASAAYARGLALTKRDKGQDALYYRALITAGLKRTAQKKTSAAHMPARQAAPARREQASPALAALAAPCLAKFRDEVQKDDLLPALAQSETCLKFSPADPALASERAPLLVRAGRYEEGVKEYERAAALYGAKDPMSAFCRVKAAETWLKLSEPDKALTQYKLALAAKPGDLNALKGLAAAQEARPDPAGALATYETILKLEPGNDKVRARREELKTALLTNDQILQELLLRQAIDAQKTALQPEDAKLFKAIKAAEISGAVDYLKAKAPSAAGLTMKRQAEGGTKLLLTGAGYKSYVFYATQDAVKFFEKKGIGLREIFQLRNRAGEALFDRSGKLTPEGETVWRNSGEVERPWILPSEPIPDSPLAIEAKAQIADLKAHGYDEISEPEYLWLLKATDCPEITLKSPPVSAIKHIYDGLHVHYMLCYDEKAICLNQCNSKLPTYIAKYRNNDTSMSENKYSTGFFGRGAIKKHLFCEDGEVWMGGGPDNPCSTAQPRR